MATITMADIRQLSVEERLQLVEDIWDTLTEHPDGIGISDAQRDELQRRLEAHRREGAAATVSWEEAEERIRGSRRP